MDPSLAFSFDPAAMTTEETKPTVSHQRTNGEMFMPPRPLDPKQESSTTAAITTNEHTAIEESMSSSSLSTTTAGSTENILPPASTQDLMKNVNDQLESAMSDVKSKVKSMFKELVVFQQEYLAVKKVLTPIQGGEDKETARLDVVQADVVEKMERMPWLASVLAEEENGSTTEQGNE